ncbi:cycloartenol synthase 1 [Perilla frutescens var. hirtella]|uniref:Terpene cyclase/mutase family member n=1 Tax=Perilla frutescens var. hirtella TaxID=608512 RepID=A0AAD4P4B4_PERFH|nr:cycloartenol synthase 1 [Perilla frutescens var. hirtella]
MWRLKIAEGGGKWVTTTNDHVGRQQWEFDPDAGTPEELSQIQTMRHQFNINRFRFKQSSDLLMRMQLRKENGIGEIPAAIKVKETEEISESATITTLRRGIAYYSTIQAHDGHWPAESAGPLFFLPPLVLALYVTGAINAVLSPEHHKEIIRYIHNHQNEDGGWGIHIEGHSTIFGSVLNYVTLRLLGEGPEDEVVARGRKWILDHGGAVGIPSWGKFWLTVLGVYEWDGCNPMPPEFWLLPKFSPIHPGKMLCYCRLVYMPMSYLYGKRFVGPITGLIRTLRQEIYTEPYHEINWNKARNTCAKEDLYYPHPFMQDMLWGFLHHFAEPLLKRWPFSKLRDKAIGIAMEHVHYEDKNSRYLCIGCVEKVLCLIACWVEDPNSEAYKRHLARIPDYFWVAEDGLKMQSFGCQMWDAAFAIQAILSANLSEEYGPTLKKAHNFVKASQVRDNPSGDLGKMYRHISKGAWTFSMQDHGWQVSDCTAEGLKVALLYSQMPPELVGEEIETERLYDAVNVILSLQSASGGFPAWEPQRAARWLEKFNPTEFFEDVLIEREYVECTSSAIQGLALFKKLHPGHRRKEIESCVTRAIQYIENTQEPDGSWYGCWGICYTYGTWFAVEGLVACGKTYHNSPTLRKACEFLLSKQLADGGWGESYLSSSNKVYTNLEGNRSNLVQSSWALLSLINAGQGEIDPEPIDRGIRLVINSQMEDGDFPQQDITGVFMKNCTLNYSSYRNIFPIWALAQYRRHAHGP